MASGDGDEVPPVKLILVTGGVISGVGKGIISSSLGVLLKAHGYKTSSIKIDPYINIDAGTFSPNEHGEVFVLDDGGEVDVDLGNYERFLDVRLTCDHNITTGKIYSQVIERERRGDYLGKTVQVVPHVTDAISNWVQRVAQIPVDGSGKCPAVCIIELGGTVGDIEGMPFVEAFTKFQTSAFREHFMNVHVSIIIFPKSTGEPKTKPVQMSIRELRQRGLYPDLLFCRSATPITDTLRNKISSSCALDNDQVIGVSDVSNIYEVPFLLDKQHVVERIVRRLKLPPLECQTDPLADWRHLAQMCDAPKQHVKIAVVGKYIKAPDAYASIRKALQHSAMHARRNLVLELIDSESLQVDADPESHAEAWKKLKSVDGILVPGGFGTRGVMGKILACKYARVNKIPFLGVCLGMQCAVIEFARNVCNIEGANSTECDSNLRPEQQVVIHMPEHDGLKNGMGGTMRLGLRDTVFLIEKCKLRRLYGKMRVSERHRHRYEVNPAMVPMFCEKGLYFVGMGTDELCCCGDTFAKRTRSAATLIEVAEANLCNGVKDDNSYTVDETTYEVLMAKVKVLCQRNDSKSDTAARMEMMELKDHPYYVGVQCHPEFLSHPMSPSPPFFGLICAASGQLEMYLRSPKNLVEDPADIKNETLERTTNCNSTRGVLTLVN
uniref:CTP synthase n=1 Tax=Syphacia muris TaxID=451379 RepID=A0A0N5AEU3_9BILA